MTKPRKIQVGTRVRFLNQVGEGRVTALLGPDQAMVEDESGFEYPHRLTELVVVEDTVAEAREYNRHIPSVGEILQQEVTPERRRAMERDFNERYRATAQAGPSDDLEVDLHLHELVESTAGLDPGTMRELQLAHFERMLQRAIEQRARRIVFIHGVGQGVLKHEIWSRVEQFYPQCTCRYADPRRYGAGATEVEISGQGWGR